MLTLIDAPRCPYCARVRITLAEKGLEHETVVIDLDDRPAWLYAKNPVGKVPVLEQEGWVLPESSVINEYLEELYPEPALLPSDPGERAAVRLLIFRHDDFTRPYYALRRGQDGAAAAFAQELASLADIAYVPWVIRARDLLDVSFVPYRSLAAWLDRLAERPSVAAELVVVDALRAR